MSTRGQRIAIAGLVLAAVAVLVFVIVRGGFLGGGPTPGPSGPLTGTDQPTPATPGTASPAPSVTSPPASGATAVPTLAPSPPGPVVWVGAGDIAVCSTNGDEATADLLDDITGTVFTLGDNAYENGTLAEFTDCYGPSWGRHKARTMPVPGNHEYNTRGATGYYQYFGAVAGDPDEGWYAYDLGSWRIYALNSNCDAIGGCGSGSAQEQWLRADLATNPKACVAAYWHHPRFSSSQHGNHSVVQGLWQALYDANAELVLAGHDHTYERFGPQTPNGGADPARGIVSFVVGTGGRTLYRFHKIRANSLVRETGTHGVLKLTLSAGSYAFDFVPEAGRTFTDSGSGTCH